VVKDWLANETDCAEYAGGRGIRALKKGCYKDLFIIRKNGS
jgi:hypothetical protein